MVRLGLIARCDDRGLGNLTWEFYRHMKPDRTLVVVEPGAVRQGFAQHAERYDGAPVVEWRDGVLDEAAVGKFLHGLDVVYSAETFYDWRIVEQARAMGVRTVLHAMPEFFQQSWPRPDAVWVPTSWRLDLVPDARVMPVPVATDRFDPKPKQRGLRLLHIVGHPAAYDRAGTTALMRAMRYVNAPITLRLITQGEHLPMNRGGAVNVEYHVGSKLDYWRLYDDADVLVSPRRYGGLSLPWNEAAAAGLALVLPDVEPNREWPAHFIQSTVRGRLRAPGGEVDIYEVDVPSLARSIEHLAQNPLLVNVLSVASIAWAQARSWDSMRDLYLAEFERVAG